MTKHDDFQRRVERIKREITSLRLGGSTYSSVKRLRAEKIDGIAERLAHVLRNDYSLLDLDRHIDSIATQHPTLLRSPDEVRAENAARNIPKAGSDLTKLNAVQRLAVGNEIERLKRLEAQRPKDDGDAG